MRGARSRTRSGRAAPAGVALASTLAAAALVLTACGPRRAGDAPSIVLVSIDTLRSDHLPAYGYSAVETPAIDALRSDGVLFEHAYSHAPTTLPAHASMLSGLLPPEHGVRGNSGYRMAGGDLPSLPRFLGERGFETGAAVSSFVLRRETGLDYGFDFYDDGAGSAGEAARAGEAGGAGRMAARSSRLQRPGSETLDAARSWLRSRGEEPFFFFLHLYEPHTPYKAPEPFASRYQNPYDAEIAAADAVVADLVAELEAIGRYTSSAVILTSDHGEGLGDHGEDEHGIFLYRESIQVPLILKLPNGREAGGSASAPAQLVDLMPTVLDLLGETPARELPGTSLIALLDAPANDRQIYSETYFPRFFFGWSELASIIEGAFQYIDSPEPELYDLANDFAQERNLVREETDTARRLRSALAKVDRKLDEPTDTNFDTWQKMAALGYVGHGQLRVGDDLKAPRSQVHLLAIMKLGFRQALDGKHAAAVETLERVVAENPFALAAWEQLGRSNERLGKAKASLSAYSEALELSDGAPHLLLAVARASARAGEHERARELAERARPWDEAGAAQVLTRVELARGELDAAEGHARTSLAAEPDNSAVLFMLAQIQLRRGSFEEALETAGKARAAAGGPVPRLELLRANILASAGRAQEAEQALRRELELFPEGPMAYSRLAMFLARHQRPREAVEVVRRLVENRPDPAGYAAAVRTLAGLGDPRAARGLLAEARRRFPENDELAALADRAANEAGG